MLAHGTVTSSLDINWLPGGAGPQAEAEEDGLPPRVLVLPKCTKITVFNFSFDKNPQKCKRTLAPCYSFPSVCKILKEQDKRNTFSGDTQVAIKRTSGRQVASGRSDDEHRVMSHPKSILHSIVPLTVIPIVCKLESEQNWNGVIFLIPVRFILVYAMKNECFLFLVSVTANIIVIPVNI